jgi:hypothetical protein
VTEVFIKGILLVAILSAALCFILGAIELVRTIMRKDEEDS